MVVFAGCTGEADVSGDKITTTITTSEPTTTADTTTLVSTTTTPTPTTTIEPTTVETTSVEPTTMARTYTESDLTADIGAHGVHVDQADIGSSSAFLNHYSSQTDPSELAGEIGTVAGGWANYVVSNNDEPEYLIVTVFDEQNGDVAGSYIVFSSDARAYARGDITAEQYAGRVMATIEAY